VPGFHLFRLPARVLFLIAFFVACLAGVGLDIVLAKASTTRSRQRVAAGRTLPPVGEYARGLATENHSGRVATVGRSIPSYGAAAPLRLQLVAGYDPFNLRHYQTYLDLLQSGGTLGNSPVVADWQPNWTDISQVSRFDMLAALNVDYLVAPAGAPVPSGEYRMVRSFENQPQFHFYEGLRTGPVRVYRNQRPLGRAFFVSDVVAAGDDRAAVTAVLNADFRATAVVEGASSGSVSIPNPGDRVDLILAAPGQLDLNARNVERRCLVVSEIWHPGWRARVDGRPTVLARVDMALQGMWLPAGEHRVEPSGADNRSSADRSDAVRRHRPDGLPASEWTRRSLASVENVPVG